MVFRLSLQTFLLGNKSLSLFVPGETEVKQAYESGKLDSPFWTQVWPSAQALALFLLDHPELIQNKKVLELGAGLGLPSLVAAQTATSVLCTDYIKEAVDVAQKSADYHSLENFSTAVLDWQRLPTDLDVDVVLLSDVNYEPDAFSVLVKMIRHFLQKKVTIVLATPQRLMAKPFVESLLSFRVRQEERTVLSDTNEHSVTLLVLAKA
ncbi:MAG: methyltransferase domain-containing protein [Chitinophagaceae bacterium]|nr:MAG: methyltransferase domain-containing protein [Chitinophagaceae bacterium]